MRSPKELALDSKLIETLKLYNFRGPSLEGTKLLLEDEEIQATQEYANNVSIVRLGFNDHGPVHMRSVALNGIIMMNLLKKAGIQTSLEREKYGDFEDSLTAVIFAAMLHDLGMSVGRHEHEFHSAYIAFPIIERLLAKVYPDNIQKHTAVRSLALEGISGHMGTRPVYSLEAGVVQVADGCDMKKGRARIPIALNHAPKQGSIHQFSANSIEEARILEGKEKPIRIEILMTGPVGLFQVEEVLMNKIAASTAKPYIELYARVENDTSRAARLRYL
jgi:metal-dependent HD superfamily phosphatase/phosphodiesterase